MDTLSVRSLEDALFLASTGAMGKVVAFVPQFLAAMLVLFVGFLLGKWAKALVKGLLGALNLSDLIKNSAVQKLLNRAEIMQKIEEVIGEVVRLFIIYIFLISSVSLLGLTTVAAFLEGILGYLPQVVSASLILAIGVIASGFTEKLVKGAVSGFDVSTGRLVGKIASYTVVIFATLVAIGELGIAERFISTLFIGFVAMLSLALGLALGLGAKDLVSAVLADWHKELKKDLAGKSNKK